MLRNFVKKIGLVAVVGLVWWWLSRNRKEEALQQIQPEITVPVYEEEEVEPEIITTIVAPTDDAEMASEPDDLTRLNGIGPKISKILQSATITTYSQLAQMDSAQIQAVLEASDIRLARFETWPEQAKLAAAGDWEGLADFLEESKAKNS